MCLYWYRSSVPKARSAGRIRRWPTTNFPCAPPPLSLPSLCFCCHCLFCYVALCLVSPSSLLSPHPVSIWGHGFATRHDTFDWSEWHSPSPLDASRQHRTPPSSRYTHNNPTAPMCLPRNASPPHPLSLVFSFHISSGHFVTDHRNGRGKHKLSYTHCRVSCLVYIDTKMLLTWTSWSREYS